LKHKGNTYKGEVYKKKLEKGLEDWKVKNWLKYLVSQVSIQVYADKLKNEINS
jgi:hypothetical protein